MSRGSEPAGLVPETMPAESDGKASAAVLIVVNPGAARFASGGVRELIEEQLRRRELRCAILEFKSGAGERKRIVAAIDRAIRAGCRRVVVAGGDGTVSSIAAAVSRHRSAGGGPAVAIIPVGTANVLARELGIPMDPAAALDVALDSEDSAELDGVRTPTGLCLTQVGIGPDAQTIDATSREEQIRSGRWAYLSTFLRNALGHPTHAFELAVDGRGHRARAWQVVVANAGAAGSPPLTWGPGIDPTDGALDLCVFTARGPRDILVLAWRFLTGDHHRSARARYFKIHHEVTIRTKEPLLVQGDGEIIGRTPITLAVARKAIRVVTPRSLADIPAVVGAPGEPRSRAAMLAAAETASAIEEHTVAHDIDVMVAMHSRSWVLQGPLKHPFAKLTAFDAALFLKVNGLPLGSRADLMLMTLSNGMHYGEGWAVVAIAMVLNDVHDGMRVTAEALVVLWLTMLTVNFPLKRLFRRRRPFIDFVRARVVGPRPRDFSFPSGHTAAAFAGALLFGSHAPTWSPIYYALACLVGFSRVYLGMHYPSDVLLGGLVGTLLAVGYRALLHRWLPGLG